MGWCPVGVMYRAANIKLPIEYEKFEKCEKCEKCEKYEKCISGGRLLLCYVRNVLQVLCDIQ